MSTPSSPSMSAQSPIAMMPMMMMMMPGCSSPVAITMQQYQQMQLIQQTQLLQQLQQTNAEIEAQTLAMAATLARVGAVATPSSQSQMSQATWPDASSSVSADADSDIEDVPLLSAAPMRAPRSPTYAARVLQAPVQNAQFGLLGSSEMTAPAQRQCPYVVRPGAWEDRRNLIVTNLSGSLSENALRKLFERFGKITRVHLVRDRETDQSRKFGFVEFADVAGAKSALQASRRLTPSPTAEDPNPSPVTVAYGRRSNERRQGSTVYIGGFGMHLKESGITALCKEYGPIASVRLLDVRKHTDGVAFVKFVKPEDAAKACRALDGSDVMCTPGSIKTLRIRLSDEVGKTEQRQQISSMLKDIEKICDGL